VIGLLLAPARAAQRVVDGLAAIGSIERELRSVSAGIEGLREDVRSMQGGVERIGASTEALETKVDEVTVHLEVVGALAHRFGRFGARRT
jgi:archaellum component FlaC